MNPTAVVPDPLAGLRGYHLPDAVAWWPPAPGWWLVAGLLLVLVAGLSWYLLRRRRRRAAARLALEELAGLRKALAEGRDIDAFVRGLSRLLRRFALARFARGRVAGLTGERWMAFLDAHGGGGRFRESPGRLLAEAPYRPGMELPGNELADLVESWIRHNQEQER
jgi:hypothetical protein